MEAIVIIERQPVLAERKKKKQKPSIYATK